MSHCWHHRGRCGRCRDFGHASRGMLSLPSAIQLFLFSDCRSIPIRTPSGMGSRKVWGLVIFTEFGILGCGELWPSPRKHCVEISDGKNAQDCPSKCQSRAMFFVAFLTVLFTYLIRESTFFRIDDKYSHVHFVQLQETSIHHLASSWPLVSCWLC